MLALGCFGAAANAGAVGKTIDQYAQESSDIMRAYRQSWASSPSFRRAMPDRSEHNDGCIGFFQRVYPATLVGLGGLIAGLVDQNNLEGLKFDWAEASTPENKRRAIYNYLRSAMTKVVACGLVDTLAWPLVGVVVDRMVKRNCVKCLFEGGSLTCATPLVSVTVVKLLLDTALFMRGWTSKQPLGKKNLVMTAVTIGLGTAFATMKTRLVSAFGMLVMGHFVTSYMDALTTEWTTKREWFYQTIGRQLHTLKSRILGQLPNGHRARSVPETLDVPSNMSCVISQELFMEPVLLHGMAFEKRDVMRWIVKTGQHPLNAHMKVSISELMPAPELRALCHEFAAQHNLGFAP